MQNFVVTLLICSATMSILALSYMAITPLLTHYSEKGRYYAWLAIAIGFIIPFRPSWASAIFTVDVPVANNGNDFVRTATQTWGDNIATIPTFTTDVSTTPIVATFDITIWHGIGLAWLIGVVVFIAYQAFRHYRFVKTARRWGEAITDEHTLSVLHELKREMGIKRQIGLYFSPCVGSPMMIGITKPQILLPTEELVEDELRFILKHELVHYRRNDLLYKSLVLVATAMHWFNPVVYLMARAVNTLCETSCDAEVIRNANEDARWQYSETIIGVVKYRSKTKLSTAFSTNFYGGKKGMKNRISTILDMKKKKAGMVIVCMVLAITLGTGIVFAANTDVTAESQPEPIPFITGYMTSLNESEEWGEWGEWLEWFNSLSPEQQAQVSLRPPLDNVPERTLEAHAVDIQNAPVSTQERRSSIVVLAEYEEWGLTLEGLYPHANGGFIATSIQNVFFQGQLIRGFSDFGHGVDMSISSFERGSDVWIHVIRDTNGNIERLDTE